ncbi:hypothetical protein A9P82_04700 [Arachidicoccus ginsenosidimutans]|uniref:hypothetical protein n=1 Tax=Arachidicoccus sp. BS20 TaxID=1850526 RepID=UPI0007F12F77|nr:hypothetical protein [Arachidicoccus sp. BS20]ANI88647.1 hypothetical protein A9P82_04700 [Arachidicoccus sp. BS20]
MAEEEKIIHHAKEAVHALTNKNKKWKEKIQDFLLEIVIIIIAVSITLWFHNWNDKRHDRQQEKEFLSGVREDLMKDTSILMGYNIRDFQSTIDFYDSVYLQIMENKIDAKYIDSHQGALTNRADFLYDDSRFQSFKSSGSLKLIENQKLLDDITYLYTIEFPTQKENDQIIYNKRQDDYDKYIGSKVKIALYLDTNGKYTAYQPVSKVFGNPEVQYQIRKYVNLFDERKEEKLRTVEETTNVIKEINKELKDRFDYDVSNKK